MKKKNNKKYSCSDRISKAEMNIFSEGEALGATGYKHEQCESVYAKKAELNLLKYEQ